MENIPLRDLINLQGKTAIVTGGAVGIGFGIANRLHEAGANITIVDIHHDNAHNAANRLLNRRPDSAIAIQADVSKGHDANRSVEEAITRFGQIEILINNAGIFPFQPLAVMTESDFYNVINTNLFSVYLYSKVVSEHMKQSGGGKIINVTSIDALHPSLIGLAHYGASKHGVWGFTKNTALELAQYNITVNAIAPGGVATPGVAAMQDPAFMHDTQAMKKAQEAFLSTIPMGRMGDPDDIGRVALFLASDLSNYMTGEQIVVDGGALLS